MGSSMSTSVKTTNKKRTFNDINDKDEDQTVEPPRKRQKLSNNEENYWKQQRQNEPNIIVMKNKDISNEKKKTLIVDHWFRKIMNKENIEIGINQIIISYSRNIFRIISIPTRDHTYSKFQHNVYLTKNQYQNKLIKQLKPSVGRITNNGKYEWYSPVLSVLSQTNNEINFDKEFVLLLTTERPSGSDQVELFKHVSICDNGKCIMFTINVNEALCCTDDMAYYGWCIVINKKCNFDTIGVKTRIVRSYSMPTEAIKYIHVKATETPSDSKVHMF
eukprot:72183_1